MSLMQRIFSYIKSHPNCTAGEVSAAFPERSRSIVQRDVYRLCAAGFTIRKGSRGRYEYSHNSRQHLEEEEPVEDTTSAKSLTTKAEMLESKGLYLRAATIWLEAFAASRISRDREYFLKRRKKCLMHSPCIRNSERVWDMAGRFNGEV